MPSERSVTHWIHRIPEGDPEAAQQLWEKYFQKLVAVARSRMQDLPRRVVDEEDLALSAFDSYCRGAEQGRFPRLEDRHNLWSLLVTITARKVLNLKRDAQRQKRSGAIRQADNPQERVELEKVLGHEPDPDFAVEATEECQRLLELLKKQELKDVALWKMEGFTNQEIAEKLCCSPRTVERKLELIRDIWERQAR